MEILIYFVSFFVLARGQVNQRDDETLTENQCLNYITNSDKYGSIIEENRLKFINCNDNNIEQMAKVIVQKINVSAIDISHLSLQSIDAIDLRQNRQLKKFFASNNELNEFPSECFRKASTIEEIDLSANQLTRIELNTFEGINTLVKVNLSANKINYIDKDAFIKLGHLESVDLRKNKISTPDQINFRSKCALTLYLEDKFSSKSPGIYFGSWTDDENPDLDLRNHSVRFRAILDEEYDGLFINNEDYSKFYVHCGEQSFKVVERFAINKNQMENVSMILQCLTPSIQQLYLSGNYLGSLNHTVFERFKNLYMLIIADTQLVEFDFSVINSSPIEILDISYNGLTSLSNVSMAKNFYRVQEFYVAGNKIQNTHELIRNLPSRNLHVLDLSDNFIGALDEMTFERFMMLRNLILRNTQLSITDFDPFKRLQILDDFDISNNNLEGVDFTILADSLRKLHFFYASNCRIHNISEVVQYLGDGIEELDLSNNFGNELNVNLFESFSKLNNLNLSNTNIIHFAPEIFQYLSDIKSMDISHNQLNELDFRLMPHRIEILYINNNRLQEITNLNREMFSVSGRLDIAENCFSEDRLNKILRNVTGVGFLTIPFKQKSNEECFKNDSNSSRAWTIIIVVISVAAIIILCVCLVYRRILHYLVVKLKIVLKKSSTVIEPNSNQINQSQSTTTTEIVTMDEPIYEELDEYVKYDKLWHEFQPMPISKRTKETYDTTNDDHR